MKIYTPEDFEVEYLPHKKIYKHIKNGEARIKIINEARQKKITPQEMREKCKKFKFLFSEGEYSEATE